MSSIFSKKIKTRVFAGLLFVVMALLVFGAYHEEGVCGWYLPAAAAVSVLLTFLALLKKAGKRSKRFEDKPESKAKKVIGAIAQFVLVVVTPLAAVLMVQNFTLDPLRIYPMMLAANCLFYILIYLLLAFLAGSFAVGYAAADVIFLLIGIANYFVVQFRGSPIVPWDLFSLGTAVSVADNYSYAITWKFVFSAFAFLALLVLHLKCTWKIRFIAVRILGVILMLGLLGGSVYELQDAKVKEKLGMDVTLFTPNVRYRNNGFLAAFLGNIHLINVQVPDHYSVAKVNEIWEETSGSYAASDKTGSNTDGAKPNIVVIMDEAFADLQALGSFETSEDYMPNFRKLMQEGNGGQLMVSVKGGNTANTEYEFLTGDTMAFLPAGSVVYQQFVRDTIPALPAYLASMGYSTTAIHPYLGTGWDRDRVYPRLGFHEFLDQDDFLNPKKMRIYISDESAFDKIEEIFERKTPGTPQFVFEVTMQNHSGYSKEYPGFTEEIALHGLSYENTQTKAVQKYLTLIYESDKALGRLMDYFRTVNEPTIVVMFGDHMPSDYITNVIDSLVDYDPELSIEEAQKSYLVPYFVWNNFGMQMEERPLTSVNYLAADILHAAGLPTTAYHHFLLNLQEQIPVICAGAYVDKNGIYHNYDEDDAANDDLLNAYNILQYNHMTDINNRVTEFFTKEDGS